MRLKARLFCEKASLQLIPKDVSDIGGAERMLSGMMFKIRAADVKLSLCHMQRQQQSDVELVPVDRRHANCNDLACAMISR